MMNNNIWKITVPKQINAAFFSTYLENLVQKSRFNSCFILFSTSSIEGMFRTEGLYTTVGLTDEIKLLQFFLSRHLSPEY